MAGLLRNTEFMLEITAVTTSMSLFANIGKANTLAAKLMQANTDPTADPISRKDKTCSQSGSWPYGKNTCTIMPALAHNRKTISKISVKTAELDNGRRMA